MRKGVQVGTNNFRLIVDAERNRISHNANAQLQITPLESLAKGLSHPLSLFEFATFSRLGPLSTERLAEHEINGDGSDPEE